MDNKHLARIAIVTLLAIGCFLILQPFIAAVLFAIIICVTTWPLYAWLLGRLGGRQALTSSVMTLLLMLVVLVPMVFLAISLADAVPALVAKLRAVFEQMAVAPPEWLRHPSRRRAARCLLAQPRLEPRRVQQAAQAA